MSDYKPMPAEQLAKIHASYPFNDEHRPWDTDDAIDAFEHVRELWDEVKQARAELETLRAEPRAACHLCRAPLGIIVCSDCGEDLAAEGTRLLAQQQAAADGSAP